ncbi:MULTISPECIES: DUF4383 domain-containing protein [unclassified Solwaraspora]|uniref:DUF4383 domain-containing protein n=1 Tax=unclassified Solwaraspora TaxID=2627926 RepID=UPI00248AC587|nr:MULTISPECIES: DUF4383 domain-containing protein [unclassified Solwaraspora]WBB97721.1 DUF4383 domain-containing protein [Solwaraspora sp. WMMA2059]WBC18388.1 DUF4383 domain-containing protein [Solwaraspora sp. WMMA2080]WJK34197.1 DUF4383 domain-containing protein [Solwaraspora sp. WMMA2065]
MHTPVNHPARPIYRAVAALTGLYLVIFGVVGIIVTSGDALFAQNDSRVLGQGANLGFSGLCLVLGVAVLAGVGFGRNIDTAINKVLAYGLMALSLAELAVLRTDANFLNFTVSTCLVVMIVGLVLLMAAMYGRIGTEQEAQAWRDGRLVL